MNEFNPPDSGNIGNFLTCCRVINRVAYAIQNFPGRISYCFVVVEGTPTVNIVAADTKSYRALIPALAGRFSPPDSEEEILLAGNDEDDRGFWRREIRFGPVLLSVTEPLRKGGE